MFDEIRKRMTESDISPQDLRIVLDILNQVEQEEKGVFMMIELLLT